MKKIIFLLILVSLVIVPFSYAISTNMGVGISVNPGATQPSIWQNVNSINLTDTLGSLVSRSNYYAFTGEKITWQVLVRDINGIGDINSVTSSLTQGNITLFPSGCSLLPQLTNGAGISWANGGITFNQATDNLYKCVLTVTPSMVGQYGIKVTANGKVGGNVSIAQTQFFYLNPSISLIINNAQNGLIFTQSGKQSGVVSPGATGYSQTIVVKSSVASGSGVILGIQIKGTDFYGGNLCPTTNQLALSNFRYYATKGSYSTQTSPTKDGEGYDVIGYTYGDLIKGAGVQASQLTEGSETSITFKLQMPIPCVGVFNSGSISLQGTAI